MLGLAQSLAPAVQSVFLLFSESGRHRAFLQEIRNHNFLGIELSQNTPHFWAMVCEISGELRRERVDLLSCAGYKADLLGLWAARRARIPVYGVSHGWTAATAKVRVYETLDRISLQLMDRVVCVSERQAAKVRSAGVRQDRIDVIRNAVRTENLQSPDSDHEGKLRALFLNPPRWLVGAAGRLSREKGFGVLITAAAEVIRSCPDVGFVLFGDGPLCAELEYLVADSGLSNKFVLAGFHPDVTRFLPHLDLVVLPSFTEGLPVIVLEAFAAGVPVVATAVGGTPEVVVDRVNGFLVPPGDPVALASRILDVLGLGGARKAMGERGRDRVRAEFTFEAQALRYKQLFQELTEGCRS